MKEVKPCFLSTLEESIYIVLHIIEIVVLGVLAKLRLCDSDAEQNRKTTIEDNRDDLADWG